ncbi:MULTISPECIES: aspartate/glutamate racemase family protein [unclassified Actinobaculum]|uniref:aspartate/glutamate racemase family protein n=1 Tax=unclassified Actinobaculum TaxID=2609299 RepID=UPI000D526024|nr:MULTISPECIES: aspartate/glutamate racemase family protein [unclassified Actinobaculum]AWE43295.1 Asp/Glu/hydantoin racemase [Actinobaculum sp. 313]RTE49811.1 Asp/Glu/hydantoin racemase [Actinobaculum sp. 352]
MKILVVNVNTTESMTQSIGDAARAVVGPGTQIVELTPSFGAESVEGNFESYLAAVAVMDVVATYRDSYDAVVLAGFGEHGKEGVMELVETPVVDITEAAAHMAMLLGDRFSVVTTLDRNVPPIEDRLLSYGLDRHCASVRSTGLGVLELEDTVTAKAAITREAERAVAEDHAEVIVLGCGGMAGLDREISAQLSIPVVEGVTAAVKLAESLVALGLSTSKVRSYAAPNPKKVTGWPLSGK